MEHAIDRRTTLRAALASALISTGAAVAAPGAELHGAVAFAEGGAIPEGRLEISLEDAAAEDNGRDRIASTRIESDGKSRSIAFSLSRPDGSSVSPTLQVVARLERSDGWLVARGSAKVDAGSPVEVTLNRAIY